MKMKINKTLVLTTILKIIYEIVKNLLEIIKDDYDRNDIEIEEDR